MIGAREISEYAQKYNMKLGKDTPLSMEWCFKMADKAYEKGRADELEECVDILNASIPLVDNMDIIYGFMCAVERLEQLKESKE